MAGRILGLRPAPQQLQQDYEYFQLFDPDELSSDEEDDELFGGLEPGDLRFRRPGNGGRGSRDRRKKCPTKGCGGLQNYARLDFTERSKDVKLLSPLSSLKSLGRYKVCLKKIYTVLCTNIRTSYKYHKNKDDNQFLPFQV